jgi:multiple antibiotic resistance protein
MGMLSISITLLLIMDPFGNLPIFLSVLEKVPAERRRRILIRELFLALALIVVFIFSGRYVIGFFNLRQEAVSIAGGIILFLIALRMVFPSSEARTDREIDSDPLLVPLATPLIAGPSLLAVLLLFATAESGRLMLLLLAALIAWFVTFIILLGSTFLIRLLTKRGLIAIERLMGMVLVALSVQLFLEGISSYLK